MHYPSRKDLEHSISFLGINFPDITETTCMHKNKLTAIYEHNLLWPFHKAALKVEAQNWGKVGGEK